MIDFYERLKDFLNENDHFCKENGMRIVEIKEGSGIAELELDTRHFNGSGNVQGGVFFTLADFSCAAAMNSFGVWAVSMSSSVSFIRSVREKQCIRAQSVLVHRGRKTAVFDVNVTDSAGTLLLHGTITSFLSDKPIEFS